MFVELDDPQADCRTIVPAIKQRTAAISNRRRFLPKPNPRVARLIPPMGSHVAYRLAEAESGPWRNKRPVFTGRGTVGMLSNVVAWPLPESVTVVGLKVGVVAVVSAGDVVSLGVMVAL